MCECRQPVQLVRRHPVFLLVQLGLELLAFLHFQQVLGVLEVRMIQESLGLRDNQHLLEPLEGLELLGFLVPPSNP